MYYSASTHRKSSLAEASWQEFSKYVSRYQWAFDAPSHSPRSVEIAHAILNSGKAGCCTFSRLEGYKYILPVLHPRHFEEAIADHRKVYYVSHGRQALLYFDIDLHHAWQTLAVGHDAQRLLDGLVPQLFWSASSRGANGYLKVYLQGEEYLTANSLFDRLEKALQRYLAFRHNLADFEIKGRLGYLSEDGTYSWAQYGKLPIHAHDWSFARLHEFKAKPTVSLRSLTALCQRIEAGIPEAVLERHKEYKKSLGDAPITNGRRFLVTPAIEKALADLYGEGWRYLFADLVEDTDGGIWLGLGHYRPGQTPTTTLELHHHERNQLETHRLVQRAGRTLRPGTDEQEPGGDRTAAPGISNLRDAGRDHRLPGVFVDDLLAEPDSHKRQHQALLRLARHLKRVPTLDEALAFIKEKSLFTGPWDQHLPRRKARVRSILKFIARSFDAGRCATGTVNVGKYDAWAKDKFACGMSGNLGGSIDEYGQWVSGKTVHVGPSFIGVFLAVAEFALLIDQNEDGSLPHRRAEELWDCLYAKGLISVKFDARKWAVCRDELEKHGIIKIVDRNYGHGQAMKWAPGTFFPFLGLWKKPRQPSLVGPVDLASFLAGRRGKVTEEHNTLLQTQSPRASVSDCWPLSRPPPGNILHH